MRFRSILPSHISDEEVTISVAAETFEGETLGVFLSDAGVSAESVVGINERMKPDIELLFEIFENPSVTQSVFGFASYEEFKHRARDPDHFDFEEQHRALEQGILRSHGAGDTALVCDLK